MRVGPEKRRQMLACISVLYLLFFDMRGRTPAMRVCVFITSADQQPPSRSRSCSSSSSTPFFSDSSFPG